MAYSFDLRSRVLQAWNQKEGTKKALAIRFKISSKTVQRWTNQTEPTAPREETRGRPPALDAQALERLRLLDEQHPDATQVELAQMLAGPDQEPLHRSIIGRALKKMGRTRKKKLGPPQKESVKTSR